MGLSVGCVVGFRVGLAVGRCVGFCVGVFVGRFEGGGVGNDVGASFPVKTRLKFNFSPIEDGNDPNKHAKTVIIIVARNIEGNILGVRILGL